MPVEKLFVYENYADGFENLVFDGAQLFSLVKFGRKDRENNQSAPSFGKSLRQRKHLEDSSFLNYLCCYFFSGPLQKSNN